MLAPRCRRSHRTDVSMSDYIKHLLVRTPLQAPAQWLRDLAQVRERRRHPELRELYLESRHIDRLLRRRLREDSNCIDVGCHIGSMLSVILRLAPGGQHMAFEPIAKKARWLRRKFPEVDVHNCALGEQAGQVTFYENVKRSGFSGMRRHEWGDGEVVETKIECRRLDDAVDPKRPVHFIKVDVEGGELGVFRGARRTLEQQRPLLVFECTGSGLEAFGCTAQQLFDYLFELDYRIFLAKDALAGEPLDLAGFKAAQVFPFKAFNFVAQPK